MKRVPEFACGLIGSILALLISLFLCLVTGSMPSYYSSANNMFVVSIFALIVSIIAIVFSCLINKNTKISSIILIISAVLLLITNLIQIISFALLLTAGIMGLVRKI